MEKLENKLVDSLRMTLGETDVEWSQRVKLRKLGLGDSELRYMMIQELANDIRYYGGWDDYMDISACSGGISAEAITTAAPEDLISLIRALSYHDHLPRPSQSVSACYWHTHDYTPICNDADGTKKGKA